MHTIREVCNDYIIAHRHQSPNTVKNNRQRLGVFALWCEQQGVTLETLKSSHIRAFIDYVGSRHGQSGSTLKDSSVRAYGKAVKSLVSWLSAEDDYGISPKVASRVELPRIEQTVIEVFTSEQIAALFLAVEKMPYPVRDRAILSVLLDSGIRASELVSLVLDHVWLDSDDSYILVCGKGRKQREVPLGRQARLAVRRYVTRYRKPSTLKEQHVFLSHIGKPLTRGGLHQIIASIGERAGVSNCHAHRFRHTYSCAYLLQGGDLLKLCRLLGHSSIRMTERYLSAVTSRQARQGESVLDRLKSL